MTTDAPEIRVTDSKARLTLPRAFANSTVLLEVRSDTEIVIRKAKVVPLDEAPQTITLSKADWAKFMEVLDGPPAASEELKSLLAGDGSKGDNKPFAVAE
jgi:uncharacterized protein (DUF1778 family)